MTIIQDEWIEHRAEPLGLLRGLVEQDIQRGGRNCSTMIRAGLLLDMIDELEARRRNPDALKVVKEGEGG